MQSLNDLVLGLSLVMRFSSQPYQILNRTYSPHMLLTHHQEQRRTNRVHGGGFSPKCKSTTMVFETKLRSKMNQAVIT